MSATKTPTFAQLVRIADFVEQHPPARAVIVKDSHVNVIYTGVDAFGEEIETTEPVGTMREARRVLGY